MRACVTAAVTAAGTAAVTTTGLPAAPALVRPVGAALARADEAPGRGHHWGSEAHHPTLTRGHRVPVGTAGPLEQILFGPSVTADGTTNLVGALRHAMATTGYLDLKEFQRIEVVTTS